MPSHPDALDKRWVDSLVDRNFIEKAGEPLATLIELGYYYRRSRLGIHYRQED
jgi:hypothetical protein